MPGETVEMMKTTPSARRVQVQATFHFRRKEILDQKKMGKPVSAIIAMRGASAG
jgi:hypothetical protein